jgi:hypothetical protein
VADSYEPSVRNGKVKKTKETLLGVRHLMDIRAASERILRAVNYDEIRLAKDMARRCLPALRLVRTAALPLFT